VKYVLTRRGSPMPPNFVPAFQGGGSITVWENKTAAPRAWISTDGTRTQEGVQFSGAPVSDSQVTFTEYSPNEIAADVNAMQNGYVIFSEIFAPGWNAVVDGEAVELLPANKLFRAVPITAGSHQVRMTYLPQSFQLGAGISGIMLLIVLGTFIWVFRTKKKPVS
jgi:hypothetical protein